MLDTMSSTSTHHKRTLDTLSSSRPAGDPGTRRRICEATLRLVARRGGPEFTLADVAKAARVSRQALYLHFADRAALVLAVVQYADEVRGIPDAMRDVEEAPTGVAALRQLPAILARLNPGIWPLARLFDAVRRHDAAAEHAWQDRLADRLVGCRRIVARLEEEGALREGVASDVATDLLWTMASLRTWEDLVLTRGWTADQYAARLAELLRTLLVRPEKHEPLPPA
jgi:AcrR family transcriptional regulator